MKEMLKLEGLSSNRAGIIVPATIVSQNLSKLLIHQYLSSQTCVRGIVYEYLEEKYRSAFDIPRVAQQTVERYLLLISNA